MQRKPKIDLEFLWSNSVRVGECWEWTGYISPQGYAYRGRTAIYRASYLLFNGPIPKGFHVHHKCKNRKCINPQHLHALNGKDHLRQHSDKYYLEFAEASRPNRQAKPQPIVIATASLPTY